MYLKGTYSDTDGAARALGKQGWDSQIVTQRSRSQVSTLRVSAAVSNV